MRIAICDFQICTCIEPLLQKYAAALPYISFDSMESLIESAKQEFFPLIFLYVEEEHSERLEQAQILMTSKQKPLIILVSETNTCAAEAIPHCIPLFAKTDTGEKISGGAPTGAADFELQNHYSDR